MSKKIVIGIVLLAGAAAALLLLAPWRRRAGRPLELSGTIEARDVQVGSLVGGRVASVSVDEGAVLKAGQTIVTLEPDLLDRQVGEQEARLEQQRANLARVQNGPRREETERAKVAWENAERERRRQESLLKEGLTSQQLFDNAAASSQTTLKSYQELARGSRPEDIAQARAAVRQEEDHLAYLHRQREELVVRAPAGGVIQSIDLRPGDLVAANQPVATILEPGQLWVRVYVPETKLGLVRLGERAALTVDTYPGRVFPGRVVEIRSQAEYTPRNVQTLEQRGDQVFGVKISIVPDPALKPGMAALARLMP